MTKDFYQQRSESDHVEHVSAVNEAILRASGLSLVIVNEEGIILSTCNEAPNLFGYKCAGSLINRNIDVLLNDEESKLDLRNHTRRRARGVHIDGSFLEIEIGLASIKSISRPGQIAITMKQFSPDLRDNLTNKIIDASFDALFCINQHGIIQMVNQKSCDVFGWSRDEFIDQNINMIMPKEHASNHDNYLAQYMKTGIKHMMGTEREVEARCKDGSTFPCVLGLNEVGIDDGGERVFCGFIRSLANIKGAQNLTHQIIDASFDALFCINQHGIIQMVNQKSCDVFGWSRDEFIDQNINMIMPKEHASNHDNYLAQYMKTGIKHMMGTEREVEARCRDGRIFPCILGLNEVNTPGSKERVFCGFIRSLSREKTLEKRASKSEKRASNFEEQNIKNAKEILEQKSTILGILDSTFDSLFVITEERIIQMVNQKSCDIFGWTKEEFIGKNINMIMTDDEAANHDQYVENYLTTGVKKMIGKQREVLAKRKDGTTFPAALGLAEPQAAGLICGFLRDLTHEKAAQAENIREQLLNSKIIDASFDGLFVIDHRGVIQRVNRASCDVFGWSRKEFIGKNIKMIMPESRAEKHDSYLSHYIETGFKKMMGKQREVEARRRDGSTFPCILGLSEVSIGGNTQFVGFIRDVTMQKSLLVAQAEREASDSLLFNILPEHIAYRLKTDPGHIADHYENTTILFADIVGFTTRASKMSAHDVVTMLNDIFSRFDHLCEHYGLNKVKTIGDCYMITSIPSDQLEHDGCARVCRFAIDMLKAVREFNSSGQQEPITFRVGIANGSVVAGVVGVKRFLFDMWGDTVNVAARMEQNGLPGKIQVTRDVVDNAGGDFTFEFRGTFPIKGKGNMDTYILKSAKPSSSRHSMIFEPDLKPKAALRCNSIL